MEETKHCPFQKDMAGRWSNFVAGQSTYVRTSIFCEEPFQDSESSEQASELSFKRFWMPPFKEGYPVIFGCIELNEDSNELECSTVGDRNSCKHTQQKQPKKRYYSSELWNQRYKNGGKQMEDAFFKVVSNSEVVLSNFLFFLNYICFFITFT